VGRGAHRVPAEAVLQRAAPVAEAVAVEEPGLVEALDDVGDLLDGRRLTVSLLQDLAYLLDRV